MDAKEPESKSSRTIFWKTRNFCIGVKTRNSRDAGFFIDLDFRSDNTILN